MRPAHKNTSNAMFILILVIAAMAVFVGIAYSLPVNLLHLVTGASTSSFHLLEYAPDVWLSLLTLVFGTLIIVISIASENTPKLIELFISDFKSRLYIWLITISCLENIYLQLFPASGSLFMDNLIFLNGYVLLPGCVFLAVPYTFYILRYTRNSNVIRKIFDENVAAIRRSKKSNATDAEISRNQLVLFETINQLHDLLQYIQFKEPKGDIIQRMGMSLGIYLDEKKHFPPFYFKLSESAKSDISFRTMGERYEQMEREKTFYEQKVLRVLGTSYLLLVRDGHYDLASLCGSEMFKCAKTASDIGDDHVVESVIHHFNTFVRYGINHGLRSREVRNIYNLLFQYNKLIHFFMTTGRISWVLLCSRHLAFYGTEVHKLSASEPSFAFLVGAFAAALKKVIIELYDNSLSRTVQSEVLTVFNEFILRVNESTMNSEGGRTIQIALCLYYMSQNEQEFMDITIDSLLKGLSTHHRERQIELLRSTCQRIENEPEEFWEETDQGNMNMFYSPNKDQLSRFYAYALVKMDFRQGYLSETKEGNITEVEK